MQFIETAHGLLVHAPAKLNLCLDVLSRRGDGFHEIDSVFQAVSLYDEIEVVAADDGEIRLVEEGIAAGSDNLVHRAARSLKESLGASHPCPSGLGALLRVRKRIPFGAGLGGGSSDAAAALLALVKVWGIEIAQDEVERLAITLGSDVPFFLQGGTARCRGRGERIVRWSGEAERWPPLHYVVVFPGIHAPTKRVYEALDHARGGGSGLEPVSFLDGAAAARALASLFEAGRLEKDLRFNRLEDFACSVFPELKELRRRLRDESAFEFGMTGSGSAFFAPCGDGAASRREADRLAGRLPESMGVFCVHSLDGWRVPWVGTKKSKVDRRESTVDSRQSTVDRGELPVEGRQRNGT
jgi:4-diphosphocytidyl-2-C-methyl-D-erythritol kinase